VDSDLDAFVNHFWVIIDSSSSQMHHGVITGCRCCAGVVKRFRGFQQLLSGPGRSHINFAGPGTGGPCNEIGRIKKNEKRANSNRKQLFQG
jgi:hypothetical protein